jgi:hypothetical protein
MASGRGVLVRTCENFWKLVLALLTSFLPLISDLKNPTNFEFSIEA